MSAAPGAPAPPHVHGAPDRTCPTCGAPARYLAIPHPDGEGTTIPLPPGAFGGKWYHDCGVSLGAPTPAMIAAATQAVESLLEANGYVIRDGTYASQLAEGALRAALTAPEPGP